MAEDDHPDLSAFDAGRESAASDGSEGAGDEHAGETAHEGDPATDPVSDAVGDEIETVAQLDRSERIELGVDLLAHVESESLSLSEAVDRIETVTTNPALTREILDTATLRGVIERESGRIRTRRGGTFVRFEEQVVQRDGDYECRRCGAALSTGHFVRFESGELGPFGPACVKKVLGRE